MAITQAQVDLLNRYAIGAISGKVPLGTLIQEAGLVESADIADGSVTAAKLAADAVTTAKILNANVTLAKLASGVAPSHIAKYAGKHTTLADGSAPYENVVVVAGVLATDIVQATVQTLGAVPVKLTAALPGSGQITLTFDGDPSTDHIVAYTVFRAAS